MDMFPKTEFTSYENSTITIEWKTQNMLERATCFDCGTKLKVQK